MIVGTNAFVFARGGSKGLPKKNILKLGGKPLIAHSIELAKKITSKRIQLIHPFCQNFIKSQNFLKTTLELIRVHKYKVVISSLNPR